MARFISSLGMVSLFTLILFTAIPLLSLALPFGYPTPDSSASQLDLGLLRRTIGNPNAAGEIYGMGLRVGAYLQIFGMLLSCIRNGENRSREGILLLSSSVCLSLFLALTILVSRHDLSPCEAWLILSLAAAYGAPRFCAVNEKSTPTAGIATVCCLASLLWQEVLYFWFWTTLYRQLPLLGTANRVWFFAPVDLAGWFRIFMVVATCLDSLIAVIAIGPYIELINIRFVHWSGAEDPPSKLSNENIWVQTLVKAGEAVQALRDNPHYLEFVTFFSRLESRLYPRREHRDADKAAGDLQADEAKSAELPDPTEKQLLAQIRLQQAALAEDKKELAIWQPVMLLWGFVLLVLSIAGVEKIIEYNSLSTTSDISTPGQVIPFILGIITFLVGTSHAIKPALAKSEPASAGTPLTPSRKPTCAIKHDPLLTGDDTEWRGDKISMVEVN
jgi:hypothetical protein